MVDDVTSVVYMAVPLLALTGIGIGAAGTGITCWFSGKPPAIRGIHSSTFQLNLSRSLSLTPPTDTEYPTKRAYVEPKSGRV